MNESVTAGFKTRELWMTIASTLLLAIWPDFPIEAFFGLIAWVVGRSAQKAFGFVDTEGNNKWLSSEFLMSIAYSLIITIFPDLPAESLYAVVGWTTTRTGIKIANSPSKAKTTIINNAVEIKPQEVTK